MDGFVSTIARPMGTTVAHEITFGAGGNSADHLADGWSAQEAGFVWMAGAESTLNLPSVYAPFGYFIEIACAPVSLKPQRLSGDIGGEAIPKITLRNPALLASYVPPGAGDTLTFRHPDAVCPKDYGHQDERLISIRIERIRILALTSPIVPGRGRAAFGTRIPDDLVGNFESLGANCELGFVQRRYGAEPLGLFRFGGADIRDIARGIDCGFCDLGTAVRPEIDLAGSDEWGVTELNYGLHYHTFRYRTQTSAEDLIAGEKRRLPFLARKLMEDISGGHKIFVHQRKSDLPIAESLPLFLALRRRGEGRLLVIEEARNLRAPGLVEEVLPGLYRGYIDRFAPGHDNANVSLDCWAAILANALALAQG